MSKQLLLPVIGIGLVLTGCAMAPKYQRPEAPVPADWPAGAAYADAQTWADAPNAGELTWQEFFPDESLRKLLETALNNNRDLRMAALNVEMARALYGIQRAELLPAVDAAGIGSRQRLPADLSSSGRRTTLERYDINVGITSWEIDFFGRIRALKEQALEQYLATEEAHRSAQISLLSAVAYTYLALAADRETLQLAQSTLETQQAAYHLMERSFEVGVATELDLHRARTQVDMARRDVARYTQLAAQDENALSLLVGSSVPSELLPADLNNVIPPREISPGMSSEVLLCRPDVLLAEHQLKAANAFIGAARAAFFPRISLTTAAGTASEELSGLFKSGSGTWSFSPRIVMPIFDARTWAALEASKAEREIALARYERTIQTAFREVADALAVGGTVDEQLSAQESLVDAVVETYRLANARYTEGVDSYLGVLDAQRSLYGAQQGLVVLRFAKLANQVRLYAVLGGGGDQSTADRPGP
jgi:multidrug efflux system outer membrane protein